MNDDYPLGPVQDAVMKAFMKTPEGETLRKFILGDKGHTRCPYCKCHLVYEPELGRMRHKNPEKGQACLFLRKITGGVVSARKCLCGQPVIYKGNQFRPKDFVSIPIPHGLHRSFYYFHRTKEQTEACVMLYKVTTGARP